MSALAFPATPLLTCPFCGHAGKWFRTGRDVGVECADGGDCPGRAQTDVYEPENAEHAAGQWNTRDDQAADHYETVLATREELLSELSIAHAIITTLQNMVPAERKAELTAALYRLHDGEGAVRYHERAAVIAKTTGSTSNG